VDRVRREEVLLNLSSAAAALLLLLLLLVFHLAVYSAANISGGHLNPAVTFSTLVCGFYPVRRLASWAIALHLDLLRYARSCAASACMHACQPLTPGPDPV
jgi:hypothetical protein